MKKYLMNGMAAVALCAAFVSCSHDDFEPMTQAQIDKAKYDQVFKNYVGGSISPEQNWGFGTTAAARMTRSLAAPSVAGMSAPYDEAWVTEYCTTASEPTAENTTDNYNNGTWERTGEVYNIDYNDPKQVADKDYFFNNLHWPYTEEDLAWINANHPNWIRWKADETWVTNFKITTAYEGTITVAASEGSSSPGSQRTIVVSNATWTINADQRIGSLGKIIIADGGNVVVESGAQLQMVNQAQLVILRGGTLSGEGSVAITNGTGNGDDNYNAGTISVKKLNNNGGNLFNYGTITSEELNGGAGNSCYYNHHIVYIGGTGNGSSDANMRIYNACQWYVTGDTRFKILENTSYFHVAGALYAVGSVDGTADNSYIAMGNGSLLHAGSLHNTGTVWQGPTTGYAVVDLGQITQLDWAPGAVENGPLANGYFCNNLWVNIDDQSNKVTGSAGNQTCETIFWSVVANGQGNGNGGVKQVKKGTKKVIIDASEEGFEAGVKGCKPEYRIDDEELVYDLRIIAEDLSASEDGDFDFNDVVFDVKYDADNAYIKLLAAGGQLKLRIDGKDEWEVHTLFNVAQNYMVNTNAKAKKLNGSEGKNEKTPVEFRLGRGINNAAEANGIKIEVFKNNEWQELTAVKGEPAAKLAVGTDYNWLEERTSIKQEYPYFVEWVNENHFESEWWKTATTE